MHHKVKDKQEYIWGLITINYKTPSVDAAHFKYHIFNKHLTILILQTPLN